MAEMKRSVKDSVFTYLFKQPEYTRQLYLALHPEDTDVKESDFKLVTLENVLTTGFYNDLGIQVRNRLILLVEAQSTFSVNIALRMLLYLAGTYKEYIEEQKLDLYGSHPVEIPRPELYVVYTGDRKEIPEALHLSGLYQGAGSAEVEVKVLRDDGTGDILDQYVRFCKIADEQREKYGLTQQAIDETIRICIAENVLAPFLASRQKEVLEIMVTLFDQEKIAEIHDYNVAKAARQEGREEGIRAMVSTLRSMSVEQKQIAQKLVEQFGLLPQAAEEKVKQYWKQ
ncbi:hypothetical protein B5G34_04900 [Flavonifractor sp. An82]|uniref:hypothetical protein n=1 Tax=Flavonifractor sp. An82 TaxID=1965660 RepID=UPI000B3926C3|nr:hypothetical protein [Flavonifractor sp. An82]OUN23323.1 hypothetical protein B5G34_04900 [Flavonifractor sp. An82]